MSFSILTIATAPDMMFALLEYGTEMKKTLKQFQVQLKLSVEEIISY